MNHTPARQSDQASKRQGIVRRVSESPLCTLMSFDMSVKKLPPRSIVFSPRLTRARVSLSCKSACRAHAGAVCVQMPLSCQMALGVISRRCLRGEQAGMFNAPVFWWAIGQSAKAKQVTLILHSSQESACRISAAVRLRDLPYVPPPCVGSVSFTGGIIGARPGGKRGIPVKVNLHIMNIEALCAAPRKRLSATRAKCH